VTISSAWSRPSARSMPRSSPPSTVRSISAISCNIRQHFAPASIWTRWGSSSATRPGSCGG
jgi:hypothetical protein